MEHEPPVAATSPLELRECAASGQDECTVIVALNGRLLRRTDLRHQRGAQT